MSDFFLNNGYSKSQNNKTKFQNLQQRNKLRSNIINPKNHYPNNQIKPNSRLYNFNNDNNDDEDDSYLGPGNSIDKHGLTGVLDSLDSEDENENIMETLGIYKMENLDRYMEEAKNNSLNNDILKKELKQINEELHKNDQSKTPEDYELEELLKQGASNKLENFKDYFEDDTKEINETMEKFPDNNYPKYNKKIPAPLTNSKLIERTAKIVEDLIPKLVNEQTDSIFYQRALKMFENSSRSVMNSKDLASLNLNEFSVGYFGSDVQQMISRYISNTFPKLSVLKDSENTRFFKVMGFWGIDFFKLYILTPEIAAHLVMKDFKVSLKEAYDILNETTEFGRFIVDRKKYKENTKAYWKAKTANLDSIMHNKENDTFNSSQSPTKKKLDESLATRNVHVVGIDKFLDDSDDSVLAKKLSNDLLKEIFSSEEEFSNDELNEQIVSKKTRDSVSPVKKALERTPTKKTLKRKSNSSTPKTIPKSKNSTNNDDESFISLTSSEEESNKKSKKISEFFINDKNDPLLEYLNKSLKRTKSKNFNNTDDENLGKFKDQLTTLRKKKRTLIDKEPTKIFKKNVKDNLDSIFSNSSDDDDGFAKYKKPVKQEEKRIVKKKNYLKKPVTDSLKKNNFDDLELSKSDDEKSIPINSFRKKGKSLGTKKPSKNVVGKNTKFKNHEASEKSQNFLSSFMKTKID